MSEFRVEDQIVYRCPRCGLEQMLLKEAALIRELEAELKRWQTLAGEQHNYEHRIAKAKAILFAMFRKAPAGSPLEEQLMDALVALEGK